MATKTTILMGALIALGTAGAFAYADSETKHENDAIAELAKTKVSLSQAVTVAEQHVSGKASRAALEDEHGRLVYNVEVASAKKVMDVKVDSIDGKVISAKPDKADAEHEGQEEDEG